MSKLMTTAISSYTSKRWFNNGQYCNRKTHPTSFGYRPYRRGVKRCHECGAKVGLGVYKRQSFNERLVYDLFMPSPILAWLKWKGNVKYSE